jgi:hypothetical protein
MKTPVFGIKPETNTTLTAYRDNRAYYADDGGNLYFLEIPEELALESEIVPFDDLTPIPEGCADDGEI